FTGTSSSTLFKPVYETESVTVPGATSTKRYSPVESVVVTTPFPCNSTRAPSRGFPVAALVTRPTSAPWAKEGTIARAAKRTVSTERRKWAVQWRPAGAVDVLITFRGGRVGVRVKRAGTVVVRYTRRSISRGAGWMGHLSRAS